jgi:hypothetical protein
MSPLPCKCPKCSSENVRFDYKYDTISNGSRQICISSALWDLKETYFVS